MPDYVRVTDKDTGNKLTILRSELPNGNYTELKADPLNANGDPLAPESKSTEGHTATTTKKENS